ncbi:MAG TPA: hypothetical protein PKD53_09440 [Chloroflexaceae bacterium]|nr:hypothetical protein [Chloroflexaceae bacterium]
MSAAHFSDRVAARATSDGVDFSLHGLVGVRLVNAGPGEVATVTRQLGPLRGPIAGTPDLTIRFVERLPAAGTVKLLGVEEGGFTEDAFLVLRSKHGARVRAQIPLGQVGRPCEIICERGLSSVPLLKPIITLTALQKGVLPIHASAFSYRGVGVITTGWQEGSKTGTLLTFMAQGARFIADDMVYLHAEANRMYGIPEPINLRARYLQAFPQLRRAIGRRERARLFAAGAAARVAGAARPPRLRRLLRKLLDGTTATRIHPHALFGAEACAMAGEPQVVFLTVGRQAPGVEVVPGDHDEVATRIATALEYELLTLKSFYYMFRFAFPDQPNPAFERSADRQQELLRRALAGKRVYAVYHAYPASVAELYAAMSPLVNP